MQAEFSVELGTDDPTLAVPWVDPESRWQYVDLQSQPERVTEIEEAQTFSELRDFLLLLNSPSSSFATAKCDAWFSEQLTEEEAIFDARCKFGSYVDVFFRDLKAQVSFQQYEAFVTAIVRLLRAAPELPAAFEVIVRHADFEESNEIRPGFYCTFYVLGYGDEESAARQAWGIAMRLVGSACLQLSRRSQAPAPQ